LLLLLDLFLAFVPNFDELLIVPLFVIVADELIKEEDDEFETDEEEEDSTTNINTFNFYKKCQNISNIQSITKNFEKEFYKIQSLRSNIVYNKYRYYYYYLNVILIDETLIYC
jgi:hypothetical protein